MAVQDRLLGQAADCLVAHLHILRFQFIPHFRPWRQGQSKTMFTLLTNVSFDIGNVFILFDIDFYLISLRENDRSYQ